MARRYAAIAAAVLGLTEHITGEGCTCTWKMATPAGTHWSGATGGSKVVPSDTSDLCQEACCQDTGGIGCVAFTYNSGGLPSEECTLWAEVPTATIWSPGWTSGKLSAPSDCNPEAVHKAEMSWLFNALFIVGFGSYFVGGIVVKRQQGRGGTGDWLPHHGFWIEVAGLVVDGVGLVLRGGKPAGYEKISAAVDAMAQEKAETGQAPTVPAAAKSANESAAGALSSQAERTQPTSLHSAATLGDEGKLERLLKGSGCPAIDSGDSRRYTAFHASCAGGHCGCKPPPPRSCCPVPSAWRRCNAAVYSC